MKARKNFTVSQLAGMDPAAAIIALGSMVDLLFEAVNRVSIGPIVAGSQPGQMDAVWLFAVFTGTGNQTLPHALARVPQFVIEAMPVLAPGETAGVFGEVQMIAATATTVTLRCQTAGKTARLLVF